MDYWWTIKESTGESPDALVSRIAAINRGPIAKLSKKLFLSRVCLCFSLCYYQKQLLTLGARDRTLPERQQESPHSSETL